MAKSDQSQGKKNALSRRSFVAAAGAGMAAASAQTALGDAHEENTAEMSPAEQAGETQFSYAAPFDSLRDYLMALEERGVLKRFKELDQDQYEATALMYRLVDEYGWFGAPTLLFEKVKIDGEWVDGPLICNHQGHWDTEAIGFGLEPDPRNGLATYRKAKDYLMDLVVKSGGAYPSIEPTIVDADNAPCKEIILRGDDINLEKFPFIMSNPADGGRYINTGSVFTTDPEMGENYGTYRCQLKGPRKIIVNPEPNQTGWKMLMAAKERGEKTAPISIVLGQDPIVWLVSSTRITNRRGAGPIDELALAGGVRGKSLEVIKSETNDMLVPAHAEMVIEGEVLLDRFEPEGPFGEMYGYLGWKKDENFVMNVTAVTHRQKPWILNQFTGVHKGYFEAPEMALTLVTLKRFAPAIVDFYTPPEAPGRAYISIKKTEAKQGLNIGTQIAQIVPIAKIVMVVDDDLDVMKDKDMKIALGSRWQPATATNIIEEARGMPLDPSLPKRPMTSKIVIDATRQWPEEGGPERYAELNRTLLEEGAPDAFDRVEEIYADLLAPKRCS